MVGRLGLGLVALCGAAAIVLGGCGGDSDSDDAAESFDSPAGSDSESEESDSSEEPEEPESDEEESSSSLTPQAVADCLDAEGAFVGTIEDDIQDPSSDAPAGLVGIVETFNGDPGSPPAVVVRFFDTQDAADAHFSSSGSPSLQAGTLVATPTAGQPDLTDEDLAPVGDCIGA